jgi:hypothetical protein
MPDRTVADVDPNTGAAVYDSVCTRGGPAGSRSAEPASRRRWSQRSTRSRGNAGIIAGSFPYAYTGSLHDVISGSNGTCGSYLCTAGNGYDGPTGLGSPSGAGGF